MAYTVNKTDSSASVNSYTVQDSVINSQTDLKFIGKGYAGYGEVIAENFLHLLENFSNSSAPSKPISGQIWFDSDAGRLKVYNGSTFVPAGGNVPYQANQPTAISTGDLWVDSDTGQLYFYNGTVSVLVGPPGTTGTTNGFTFESILDSSDNTQNITNLFNDGNRIAIISEDTFTPKSSISGFATIKKGITLSTAISDLKFQGTATDSDSLGGAAASTFLKSNANDTTTGTLGIVNDNGLTVGTDSDLKLSVDSSGAIIQNVISNTDISFKVNDGGSTTTVLTIDGTESRVGIGTTTPGTKLEVNGTITATAFTGALTGAVTGNITGSASLNLLLTGGTLTGTLNSRAIIPTASNTYDLGSAAKTFANFHATTGNFTTITAGGTATLGTIEATNLGFADSSITVNGISTDGELGGDANGVFTNASNSMLVTEQAVKRYVDRQADLYFSLDTTGLNQTASAGTSGSVAELLGTLAPVANFRPLTKAYVASVVQNANTIATTTDTVSSIGSTKTFLTGVTPSIANPTRNNDLIYRVNSGGTSWEYVSG
jgi:hypothetical protein|tara:strand:- start:994 stop:2631 length:1638 start_codon:yes stop_codon:yes gene_type:complete